MLKALEVTTEGDLAIGKVFFVALNAKTLIKKFQFLFEQFKEYKKSAFHSISELGEREREREEKTHTRTFRLIFTELA